MVNPANRVTPNMIQAKSTRSTRTPPNIEISARKIGTSRCATSMALVSQMKPATSAAAAGDGRPWK